jgi:hypothetical protein
LPESAYKMLAEADSVQQREMQNTITNSMAFLTLITTLLPYIRCCLSRKQIVFRHLHVLESMK